LTLLGVRKKSKNRENQKKINRKNRIVKKKLIKIFKKPAGSVRFRFYKPKTEKTEPNRKNWQKNKPKPKKPSQISLNRFFS